MPMDGSKENPITLREAIEAERNGRGFVRFVCGEPQWFERTATEDDVTRAQAAAWNEGRAGW